jgi:hypothetical protein
MKKIQAVLKIVILNFVKNFGMRLKFAFPNWYFGMRLEFAFPNWYLGMRMNLEIRMNRQPVTGNWFLPSWVKRSMDFFNIIPI